MYDVDRENNLLRAIREASESDAELLSEALLRTSLSRSVTMPQRVRLRGLQDALRHRLDELDEERKPDLNDVEPLPRNPALGKLQRELAGHLSESTLPRSSDTEVDALVAERLALAFEAAGWTAPADWPEAWRK